MDGQGGPTHAVSFSPDGGRLVTAGSDGSVAVWDLEGAGPLGRRVGNEPGTVAASPDGRTFALSGPSGVQLVDADTLEARGEPIAPGGGGALVAFSPDSRELALTFGNGSIQRYDVATGQPVGPPLAGHSLLLLAVSYSPDGQRLVSGGFDNQIIVHDLATGQPVAPPWRAASLIMGATFTPDGSQLYVAAFDGTLALLDARTLVPIVERLNVEGFHGASSVAIRPGGAELTTGGGDGTVTTWDLATRRPIRTFAPHSAAVHQVTYSADGRLLATASTDGTARLVDADTGRPIGDAFPKPANGPVGFTPDGRRMVAPDLIGAVVYDTDHERWAEMACARAGRNLTPVEWNDTIGSLGPHRPTCPDFPLPTA